MAFPKGTALDWSWQDLAEADIPAEIARDTEVDAKITNHNNYAGPIHPNATGIGGKSFGASDGNLLVLPTATEGQVLRRDATAWEAGTTPERAVDVVPSLPSAGAQYLGKFRILRTGTSQVSKLYLCVQNSTDNYEWIQVAIST
jgi:hypothetical protein